MFNRGLPNTRPYMSHLEAKTKRQVLKKALICKVRKDKKLYNLKFQFGTIINSKSILMSYNSFLKPEVKIKPPVIALMCFQRKLKSQAARFHLFIC